jgi:hypothetical protein
MRFSPNPIEFGVLDDFEELRSITPMFSPNPMEFGVLDDFEELHNAKV